MLFKDKKIALFCALPHHTRFLYPLAEAAQKEGANILFFTSLVDYPYEMEIKKRNFVVRLLPEYADTQTRQKINKSTKEILKRWTKINFKWHGFLHWSLFQQYRALTRNVEDYFCIEEMIKTEKPDILVSLHEMNPWGKQIGYLAYKYAVPFITLQEGDYYNILINLTTHTEYSMANLLWGYDTQHRLALHKCSQAKMVIIGNTYLDSIIKKYSSPSTVKEIKKELKIPSNKKVVTLLLNTFWGGVDDKDVWRELLKGLKRPDIFVILKWHPQVPYHLFQNIKTIIKELLPEALIFFSEDPYKIIAVSHYCVVMGKTTLAVEALAFGKPLFDLYNIEGGDEFYKESGIAQSVSPAGHWEALFNTIKTGTVPPDVDKAAKDYIKYAFYERDGKATDRAIDVISFILNNKGQPHIPNTIIANQQINKRASFIILAGTDTLSLSSTLRSLSKYIQNNDYELLLITTNKHNIGKDIANINNIQLMESNNASFPAMANEGAKLAASSRLIFIISGICYHQDDGFMEAIDGGIAGMPIYNADLTPYCLGMGFDFNFTPYQLKKSQEKPPEYISTSLIGIDREVFIALGGFDETVAFSSVDLCLNAKEKGYPVRYIESCMAFAFKQDIVNPPDTGRTEYHYNSWQKKLRFFSRWYGKLPKDDDYLSYAKDFFKAKI
ncbi:MAG: hypothetical protein L3V56_09260 [Candidatus Magnetoovum sp. WYHC-5]|nr:hypothetical protein [Candidatus Magnetoovum sp. WYHC-5]